MKKILLIAVTALFAFAAPRQKSILPASQQIKSKSCGTILSFYNSSGASVSKIVVDWSNTAYTDQTYLSPSFPFNTGTRCCGGGVTIIVYFTSGLGLIQASITNDGTVLACETFEAPHLSPLVFTAGCDDYDIHIMTGTECP